VSSLSVAILQAASNVRVWTASQEMATTALVNRLLQSRQSRSMGLGSLTHLIYRL